MSTVQSQVRDLLRQRDLESLVVHCEADRRFWKALRFSLYDPDDDLVWPAIEGVGRLMRRWWESGREEKVREYVRSLLWSLNDESGGIGWNAPQAIAETIALIPSLLNPYASMMLSRALDEPPLHDSALWAVGRLGERVTDVLLAFEALALNVFRSSSPRTLGLACWGMGAARLESALPHIRALLERYEPVRIYREGIFVEKGLGEWAREAVSRIAELPVSPSAGRNTCKN